MAVNCANKGQALILSTCSPSAMLVAGPEVLAALAIRYIYVGGVVSTLMFRPLGPEKTLQGCLSTHVEVQVCATANMHNVAVG